MTEANSSNATTKKRGPSYSDALIIETLKLTRGMIYVAADRLGCDPQTIYKRMNKSVKIKTAVDDARGRLLDKAEIALESAVVKEEAWAVCFTLKTIGKHRGYVERTEITGADNNSIRIEYVNDWRNQTTDAAPRPNSGKDSG